jgi:hypothetical protein
MNVEARQSPLANIAPLRREPEPSLLALVTMPTTGVAFANGQYSGPS